MARRTLTESSLRQYLQETVNEGNYALFHGLHRLPKEDYDAIMELLINGEAFPEELLQLGTFSAPEAKAFIERIGVRWDGRHLSQPGIVTSSGYTYYLDTLGLRQLLAAAEVVGKLPTLPVSTYTGVTFRTGLDGHYPSQAALLYEWQTRVMPSALEASGAPTLAGVFPASPADILALPIPNSDAARQEKLLSWYQSVFAPVAAYGGGLQSLFRTLYGVDGAPSRLSESPSFAQFLLAGTRPGADAQLRLHRAIAANRIGAAITQEQAQALVDRCFSATPGEWGATAALAEIDFDLRLVAAWGTVHNGGNFVPNFGVTRDALQALYDHRDRMRRFIWQAHATCLKVIYGSYPVGDAPVNPAMNVPTFGIGPDLGL